MRLIDADALIRQMEADAEQMEEPIAKMFTYAAINDVKHAPTVTPEPKWIPCTERLPKDGEEVFVYLFGNSPYIAWFRDGEWCTEEFYVEKESEPTAWMPLPEPWKGET